MLIWSAWPNSVSNQSYWLLNISPLLSKPSPYICQLSAQNLPKMKIVQLLCFEFFVKMSEYTNNFRHFFFNALNIFRFTGGPFWHDGRFYERNIWKKYYAWQFNFGRDASQFNNWPFYLYALWQKIR